MYNYNGDDMSNNKKKKRKLKKKSFGTICILIIFILFVVFGFILLFNNTDNKDKLSTIGYSNIEIKTINKLTKSQIKTILKYDYNSNLVYMVESKNYDPNKLDLYMEYTLKYKDKEYLKIFELINNKDFKENNIDKYVKLLDKCTNTDGIVNYINNYGDKDIEVDDTVLAMIGEKYFIGEYAERYSNYYKKHSNLDYSKVIADVNSNLDYEYYTDAKEADTSKEMHTLVNKYYYLTKDYKSKDIITISNEFTRDTAKLNKTAYENFEKMAKAAKNQGLTIKITTGYRDYNFQATLYNNYVKSDGVKAADTYSARPGYSEHQLGYSADLTNGKNVSFDYFELTDEYKWLKDNAHKFGFIMRFPKDKEDLTGYKFESWHYRYVGEEIAKYIYENDITYEEYYAYFLR